MFLRASQGRVGLVVIVLQPSALHGGGDLAWAMLSSIPCAAFSNMATLYSWRNTPSAPYRFAKCMRRTAATRWTLHIRVRHVSASGLLQLGGPFTCFTISFISNHIELLFACSSSQTPYGSSIDPCRTSFLDDNPVPMRQRFWYIALGLDH